MTSVQFRRCCTCSRCCCCSCYCWSSSAYRSPSSVHPYTCQLSRRAPSTSNRSPAVPRCLLSGFLQLSVSCWQFPLTCHLTRVTRSTTSEADKIRLIYFAKTTLIAIIFGLWASHRFAHAQTAVVCSTMAVILVSREDAS